VLSIVRGQPTHHPATHPHPSDPLPSSLSSTTPCNAAVPHVRSPLSSVRVLGLLALHLGRPWAASRTLHASRAWHTSWSTCVRGAVSMCC
jgi:hypothetical protein